jgi:hypothetical protein
MPWVPELFSAPVVAQFEDRLRRDERVTVPYFAGFLTGETDALIQSFTGRTRGSLSGPRARQGRAGVRRIRGRNKGMAGGTRGLD